MPVQVQSGLRGDVKQFLSLLHSLGSLVWFHEPEELQELVMLNPRKVGANGGMGEVGGGSRRRKGQQTACLYPLNVSLSLSARWR